MTPAPEELLVAVDGSPASLAAAKLAIELAASWSAHLLVVAVMDDGAAERMLDRAHPDRSPARERRRAALEGVLSHLVRQGTDAGVNIDTTLRERSGVQPYEVILEEAESRSADLIFVGRTGHRGIGRALLGTQTEHILEFTRLPVVVVPARSV